MEQFGERAAGLTSRPLAYIMAPVALHTSFKYQECYERAKIVFSDYAVLPGQFADTPAWLKVWPQIRPLIDVGILVQYRNSMTPGVQMEVRDLVAQGCAIYTYSLGLFILNPILVVNA